MALLTGCVVEKVVDYLRKNQIQTGVILKVFELFSLNCILNRD